MHIILNWYQPCPFTSIQSWGEQYCTLSFPSTFSIPDHNNPSKPSHKSSSHYFHITAPGTLSAMFHWHLKYQSFLCRTICTVIPGIKDIPVLRMCLNFDKIFNKDKHKNQGFNLSQVWTVKSWISIDWKIMYNSF